MGGMTGEIHTNTSVVPSGGGYEVRHTSDDGTTITTLCLLPTEERALGWLETWYCNVKLGRSTMAAFKIANQLWGNDAFPEELK